MTPELQELLANCRTLPSPPGVATQIISLASDPEADMDRVAKVLSADPAIATKILRIANSSMYAQQRELESLRQATVVVGLNATMSLALSFSLLKSWQGGSEEGGLDYPLYWRRALMSATVSGVLARAVDLRAAEELFLASLIQDIGMLALDRSVPDLYAEIGSEQIHQAAVIATETEKLGSDHADVGGWLLKQWNFPERLQQAVAASHDFDRLPAIDQNAKFARCVAFTSLIAEAFLDKEGEREFKNLAEVAEKHFDLDKEALGKILDDVGAVIPDAERVFETKILVDTPAEMILEDAKEALMLRNLQVLNKFDSLQGKTDSLVVRTKELEELSQRDTLTGLYNRRTLDTYLEEAFVEAAKDGQPLSFAFADLDRFKDINDNYGHQVGDQILKVTAKILHANVRSCDFVARYGGEEFVIAFPRTDRDLVQKICQRIVTAFQDTLHDVGHDKELSVTISVGMATYDSNSEFESVGQFVQAADKALYKAKLQGRNRTVAYDLCA